MDALKKSIAANVQNFVLTFYGNLSNARSKKVTDLITTVAIQTPNGPRYFEVTVKEAM